MSELLARLIKIIGREASVFECILRLIKQQKSEKTRLGIEEQNRLTALQRVKLVESRILRKKREKLISRIKSANAIQGDLNISRLLELVDEEEGNKLIELGNLISGLSTKMGQIRDQNTQLLERTRENISKTLEFLSKVNSQQSSFQNRITSTESKLSN